MQCGVCVGLSYLCWEASRNTEKLTSVTVVASRCVNREATLPRCQRCAGCRRRPRLLLLLQALWSASPASIDWLTCSVRCFIMPLIRLSCPVCPFVGQHKNNTHFAESSYLVLRFLMASVTRRVVWRSVGQRLRSQSRAVLTHNMSRTWWQCVPANCQFARIWSD